MGSLPILAASRIQFKGRVRSLPVEDDSPHHLLTPSKKALPRPQSHVYPPLQPSLLQRFGPFLQLSSSLMDHSPAPPHRITQ